MRHILAATALVLIVLGGMLICEPRWEGLIALFVGGCLWWTALYLSRAAWQTARAGK